MSLVTFHLSDYRTRAPAKLNLRLKVTGRRPDGYHELISLMVPVDLCDVLELEVIQEGVRLVCDGFPVPADETNLVYRAVKSFQSQVRIQRGISIRLVKNIPVAAGLGGGSSDAAAVLLSLNEIWGRPYSQSELSRLAVGLGADVPFFLYCRPSLASGIGEILEPLPKWPKLWYVIVTPPLQVSTSWVYRHLKLKLTTGEYDYIVKFLDNKPLSISPILENDLEEVTSARFPIINTIKRLLLDAGAEGVLMTGSGPSVFGVFPSRDQATSAKEALISQHVGHVYVVTDWDRK